MFENYLKAIKEEYRINAPINAYNFSRGIIRVLELQEVNKFDIKELEKINLDTYTEIRCDNEKYN